MSGTIGHEANARVEDSRTKIATHVQAGQIRKLKAEQRHEAFASGKNDEDDAFCVVGYSRLP